MEKRKTEGSDESSQRLEYRAENPGAESNLALGNSNTHHGDVSEAHPAKKRTLAKLSKILPGKSGTQPEESRSLQQTCE